MPSGGNGLPPGSLVCRPWLVAPLEGMLAWLSDFLPPWERDMPAQDPRSNTLMAHK